MPNASHDNELVFNDDFKYKLLRFMEEYRLSPSQMKAICSTVEVVVEKEQEKTKQVFETKIKAIVKACSKINKQVEQESRSRSEFDLVIEERFSNLQKTFKKREEKVDNSLEKIHGWPMRALAAFISLIAAFGSYLVFLK